MNRAELDELAEQLRAWALAYARHAWAVFPLAPGTKVPALSRRQGGRGCLDATTAPAVVDRMWRRFRLGNVGIGTGEVSGLAVLDVDPRHDGDASLDRLTTEHGPLPAGPVAETPSGGRHYFMQWHPGLSCSAGALGPGLDVRSDGGYVAAAPSVRSDGRYSWLVHPRTPLPAWPDWLTPPRAAPTPIRAPHAVEAAAGDRVLAGLVRTVTEATVGARNSRLYWAACRLAEHAAAGRMPLDVGAAALLAAAAAAGLSDSEADRTLRSALRQAVAS